MSTFLPYTDPDPVRRAKDLETRRRLYNFNYDYLSPLAVIDRVPRVHEFSLNWLKVVGEKVVTTLANRFELEGETRFANYLRAKHSLLLELLSMSTEMFSGLLREIVHEALKLTGRQTTPNQRPRNLDDYTNLFQSIGLPPIPFGLESDQLFALGRVAGPNPVMLQRIASLDSRFPIDEALFQSVIPGDSLAAAAADARLYLIDYAALDGVEWGSYPHHIQKYVYAPLALFVVDKQSKRLRTVGIQCKQKPGPDNPIFTPQDGYNWLMAKTIVEIADGNYHEAVTHLGRTHLLMEPFVVCTYRQLAESHPLFQLLTPHFEGTLAINEAAWRHLIANKGAVDKLFGTTVKVAQSLTFQGVQGCLFNDSTLPRTLEARGVHDPATLPNYPYRDDAILYWDAIQEWVKDYVGLYYASDADVNADAELVNWLRELGDRRGGRINGIGSGNNSLTIANVIDTVTTVLYTCSVQHAAVNFPQYNVMSYVPAMPLAGYAPAPTSKTGATQADFLNMLPPMDMAELQMELGYLLGTVHYTTLGQYPPNHFRDARVPSLLGRFQARIQQIGEIIETRNQTRVPYQYLVPSGIPQSINI